MLTTRKRKVVKRKRKHEAMPCIEEIDETSANATLKANFGELDELAEIENEFVDFVLPWLKLVPKDCAKSSKVCSTTCGIMRIMHFFILVEEGTVFENEK